MSAIIVIDIKQRRIQVTGRQFRLRVALNSATRAAATTARSRFGGFGVRGFQWPNCGCFCGLHGRVGAAAAAAHAIHASTATLAPSSTTIAHARSGGYHASTDR